MEPQLVCCHPSHYLLTSLGWFLSPLMPPASPGRDRVRDTHLKQLRAGVVEAVHTRGCQCLSTFKGQLSRNMLTLDPATKHILARSLQSCGLVS